MQTIEEQQQQEQQQYLEAKALQAARQREEEIQSLPGNGQAVYSQYVESNLNSATIAKRAADKARAEVEAAAAMDDSRDLQAEIAQARQSGFGSTHNIFTIQQKYAQRAAERQAEADRRATLAERYSNPIEKAMHSLDERGQQVFEREVKALVENPNTHTNALQAADAKHQEELHAEYSREVNALVSQGKRYAIPLLADEYARKGMR